MSLSRNILWGQEVRPFFGNYDYFSHIFGCSQNKTNRESRDKGIQKLTYSSQWNENKEVENLEKKMVPAVLTGDGKLHWLDNFKGGNFYAFKIDVEEGYFFDNTTVPISAAIADIKKVNHNLNIPVFLRGKIVNFMGENKFLIEVETVRECKPLKNDDTVNFFKNRI